MEIKQHSLTQPMDQRGNNVEIKKLSWGKLKSGTIIHQKLLDAAKSSSKRKIHS